MESTPERMNAVKRAYWLIRLRWVGILGVLLATFVGSSLLGVSLAQIALYVTAALLACYNAAIWWWTKRSARDDEDSAAAGVSRLVKLQIYVDLAFLTLLLHFSGGIENPFMFFFIFHMIIASILLSLRESYAQAAFAVLLFGLMVLLEHLEMVPHYCLQGFVSQCSQHKPLYVLGTWLVFAATLFLAVYMASDIVRRRRQAEQALRVSRDYMARILDSMYEGLMVIDSDFVITDVNRRLLEQCGLAREKVIGRKCHQISHHADRPCSDAGKVCPVEQVFRTARHVCVEHVHLDAADVRHFVELNAFPLLGPDGQVTAVVELSHDVTERKHSEDALKTANTLLREKERIKDEYVRRVTHDIKGHLGAVLTCLELATGGIIGPLNDQQTNFLGRARERTKSLVSFLKTLLRLTEIRLCDRTDMAAFSLGNSLHGVMDQMKPRALDRSIALSCQVDAAVGEIFGNALFFEEAVSHLVQNAIKYTPEHGTVTVTAVRQGSEVLVDVADTGIGIPQDDLPRIFEEFFRASNARAAKTRSTGLGLSIVQQIVDKHDGHIGVESQEGQGTTFRVTLPDLEP